MIILIFILTILAILVRVLPRAMFFFYFRLDTQVKIYNFLFFSAFFVFIALFHNCFIIAVLYLDLELTLIIFVSHCMQACVTVLFLHVVSYVRVSLFHSKVKILIFVKI